MLEPADDWSSYGIALACLWRGLLGVRALAKVLEMVLQFCQFDCVMQTFGRKIHVENCIWQSTWTTLCRLLEGKNTCLASHLKQNLRLMSIPIPIESEIFGQIQSSFCQFTTLCGKIVRVKRVVVACFCITCRHRAKYRVKLGKWNSSISTTLYEKQCV